MQFIHEMKPGDIAFIAIDSILKHEEGGLWVKRFQVALPTRSKKLCLEVHRSKHGHTIPPIKGLKENKLPLFAGSTNGYIELKVI